MVTAPGRLSSICCIGTHTLDLHILLHLKSGISQISEARAPIDARIGPPGVQYHAGSMHGAYLTETTPPKAVDWVKKLHGLQRIDPIEMEKTTVLEYDAFSDLAVTAAFAQSVSASFALPPATIKKGQMYLSNFKYLDAELEPLRREIDLSGYAIPIDNLRQPGMAQGALAALGRFIIDKTGADIGFLYQDLNESCLFEIQNQYEQQRDKEKSAAAAATPGLSIPESSNSELQVTERRQKVKSRPAHSSIYNITRNTEAPEKDNAPEAPTLKVGPSTFAVFSTPEGRFPGQISKLPWLTSDSPCSQDSVPSTLSPRLRNMLPRKLSLCTGPISLVLRDIVFSSSGDAWGGGMAGTKRLLR
ncbi:hypothetical protein BO83DRAFT_446738 [Aspergillus eucalypticola CBS 122712]|uniref:Uncharacterized protein n=1 Tax=Aspergillus eucalypticola (strain CBS 122712 / IBT 29274) TaxID=1448314 RepID=A0A317VA72_ASPEC|nr:uncharacterized protein BO83DRAFT_446738 [Aspergillus eucalypticola CBS 122712]PWY71234.1 hypothetical protein BO83DRAFT_446738 [Aspergillus eucalypticola CBS 122712]